MANYLVTGAAGFIASRLCAELLDHGHVVVGMDNLNDYYDVRIKDYRLGRLLKIDARSNSSDAHVSMFRPGRDYSCGRFTFRNADIESRGALEALFSDFKFDAVFNLAARAGVRASIENPYVFLSTNTEGTLNILECQRKFGVGRQVIASTSSLYAGNTMPFSETLPVNTPLSPYAAAKKAAELMAYSYHRLYGLDICVLRYFTVIGPAGRPDMALFRFIKWIDQNEAITLYGDGTQTRDFTYVDDIVEGTIRAAAVRGYEIINLGGGKQPIALRQIIDQIEIMLGRSARIIQKPFHGADMVDTQADIRKAKELLGWAPSTSVADAVRHCVEWHIANRDWLKAIHL